MQQLTGLQVGVYGISNQYKFIQLKKRNVSSAFFIKAIFHLLFGV